MTFPRTTTFLLVGLPLLVFSIASCSGEEEQSQVITNTGGGVSPPPTPSTGFVLPDPDPDAVDYSSLHDELKDVGQFYIPEFKADIDCHWTMVWGGGHSNPDKVDMPDINDGLQNRLLMQSVAGLANKACKEGRSSIGVWIEQGGRGYLAEKEGLGKEIGKQTALELATRSDRGDWEGRDVDLRHLFEGYVLTDVARNPESANVAAVASHVYNSLIVDVRDSARFNSLGFEMKRDCSKMTTADAFREFKDKCDNSCLVVMPVQCEELRSFAITHRLFVFNLNKKWGEYDGGNDKLFDEVLDWLAPNSQVLGWEQGVGEDVFVDKVSRHGHQMLAADWSYNHELTSRNYKDRQPDIQAKTINPRSIDYGAKKSFCSFFVSDGDNYQFIIQDNFVDNYYALSSSASAKVGFEIGTQSLIQLAPTRFEYLMERQPSAACTVMDTFGGGYYYVDTYSTAGAQSGNRARNLEVIARRTAAHMRQHGIKVLHVMAKDLKSSRTKEALQAFVDANDQLEGITAVQYDPYDGGKGEVLWFKNKAGYDIPCITTKYRLWAGITTPDSIAADLVNDSSIGSTSTIVIHAWSSFDGRKSSDLAAMCKDRLPSSVQVVSVQELVWRLRMREREEQTMKFLAGIR